MSGYIHVPAALTLESPPPLPMACTFWGRD